MAIFKYTVANKEGKKLSGTVEAPDENIARGELNNLGFSILTLQETQEAPVIDKSLSKFVFEAVDKNAKLVSGTIPAKTEQEALTKLKSEYNLHVSAIWPEDATAVQIQAAKNRGAQAEQESEPEEDAKKLLQDKKMEQFTKAKIENILGEVNQILKTYDAVIDPAQKAEIAKKIDKILRIKHSTNLEYILESTQELLDFLQSQEEIFKNKGLDDQRLQYKLETKKLLDELKEHPREKTFSEDVLGKIDSYQKSHHDPGLINRILGAIRKFFETPPEILALQDQIRTYNKQLWAFAQLYFKEPTKDYREKVKRSMSTIWQQRKNAKAEIKAIKARLRNTQKDDKIEEDLFISFTKELNAFTGWLLGFYIIYYFVALYISSKNFGLTTIPDGFLIYQSHVFKYVLVILFLLHSVTSLKVNFFQKSVVANIILPPVFIFGTIITLLNF